MLPELKIEPVQTDTQLKPIFVEKRGYKAEIVPLFKYEISGIVVEEYDSEVWHDVMHKKFDPFNTKDLCLVWGDNTENDLYRRFDYKHGEFTCYYQTKDMEAYKEFNNTQLSNNHLIPANDKIYKKIKNTSISDQVRIKGYLVENNITSPEGLTGQRGTSISRNDTGNGACEQIYVEEYEIIKKGNLFFALMYNYSIYIVVASLILLILVFVYELRHDWKRSSMKKYM